VRLVTIAVALLIFGAATAGATVVAGGTPAQQQLARQILVRLAPTRITSVRFRPSRFRQTPGQETDVKGVDGSIRTDWEEKLFWDAFVLAAERRGIEVPDSVMTDTDSRSVENIAGGPKSPPTGKQLSLYLRSIRAASARAHAQIVGLRVLRPGPVAVAFTLKVSDPAAFLKHRSQELWKLYGRGPAGLYAAYIGLKDSHGTVVWAAGWLPNEGGYYVRPDLYSCSPAVTFAPPRSPPPCPA
jgi:hypothetical protein